MREDWIVEDGVEVALENWEGRTGSGGGGGGTRNVGARPCQDRQQDEESATSQAPPTS